MKIRTTSRISSRARMPLVVVVLAMLGVLVLAGCGTSGPSGSGLLLAGSVNGHGISLDDYQRLLAAIKASNALNGQQVAFDWQTPTGRSILAQAQKDALDYLIDAELIHEQVVKQHIAVSQKDVAAEEKQIHDSVASTVKQRKDDPLAQAYNAAFNTQLIHLVAQVDTEHKAFVAHGVIPTAHVRMLVLNASSKDVQAKDVQSKAAQLTQQAQKGADFGQLVKANSQDTQTAANGGDLGTVYAGEFSTAIDAQIFASQSTYVTVLTGGNVYVFEVTQRANKPLNALNDQQTEGNDLDKWIHDVVRAQPQTTIERYIEGATAIGQ
ncbi:MAG: peptidylprolyl isomerase [Ktedonobacterales bacterium]